MMRGYFDGFERFSRVGYGMFGGQFMWVGMLLHLLLVVGVVLLIIWIIKKLTHPKTVSVDSSKAIDILKERYAKGEITKEEYDGIKKDLQ